MSATLRGAFSPQKNGTCRWVQLEAPHFPSEPFAVLAPSVFFPNAVHLTVLARFMTKAAFSHSVCLVLSDCPYTDLPRFATHVYLYFVVSLVSQSLFYLYSATDKHMHQLSFKWSSHWPVRSGMRARACGGLIFTSVQTACVLCLILPWTFLKHRPKVLCFLLAPGSVRYQMACLGNHYSVCDLVVHGSVLLASSFFFNSLFSSQLLNGTVTSNSAFILLSILSNVNKAVHLTCCLFFTFWTVSPLNLLPLFSLWFLAATKWDLDLARWGAIVRLMS